MQKYGHRVPLKTSVMSCFHCIHIGGPFSSMAPPFFRPWNKLPAADATLVYRYEAAVSAAWGRLDWQQQGQNDVTAPRCMLWVLDLLGRKKWYSKGISII